MKKLLMFLCMCISLGLAGAVLREWTDKIARRGYDTSKLIFVDQTSEKNK